MILITVARTLFYQFFLLFIGISIGFICNAEWVGWKSNLVEKSVCNIFCPVEFNEKLCKKIKNVGAYRLFAFENYPKEFTIVEDGLLGEEFYIAKFKYTNVNGKTIQKIKTTRVRWKTWEYYWEDPTPATEEEINKYLSEGTLNSKESDKALRLYRELKEGKINEKNNNSNNFNYTNFIL